MDRKKLWITGLLFLLKRVCAYPTLNTGRKARLLPSFDHQVSESFSYFSPNCSAHVILTNIKESFGYPQVPYILSFPKGRHHNYKWFDGTGTHGISRDILHSRCLLTIILAPRTSSIYRGLQGSWFTYLMEAGAQMQLKLPKYYVGLTNDKYRSNGWPTALPGLQQILNEPGGKVFFIVFYNVRSSMVVRQASSVGARVVCYFCSMNLVAQVLARECLELALRTLNDLVDGGRNGGTSLIVTVVSKRRGYKSIFGMLKRALLWIYSALREQPDDSNFSTSRTANGAPRAVLLLTLFMYCAVNNVYRALLNVAYLTGNEFETKWEEVR